MNPYNQINDSALNGLDWGWDEYSDLDGLAGWGDFKKKLKKTIRKVGKVVAPIAVGMVAGPAAGAAVASGIKQHRDSKKEAQAQAKELGVSWTQFKNMSESDLQKQAEKVALQTGSQAMGKATVIANNALTQLENTPAVQDITRQLSQQGISAAQREQLFLQSQPAQQIIRTATTQGYYTQARQNGFDEGYAAAIAGGAEKEMKEENSIQKYLPWAIGAFLLIKGI